jgi:hypothetical protein
MTAINKVPTPIAVSIDRIVHRAAERRSFSSKELDGAGVELIKFLCLCAESDVPLAPSAIIDDFWHEFILHTRDYAEFCASTLGTFVHHVPSTAPDPTSYRHTLERMSARFGNVNARFWPSNGADCESSCGSKCGDR